MIYISLALIVCSTYAFIGQLLGRPILIKIIRDTTYKDDTTSKLETTATPISFKDEAKPEQEVIDLVHEVQELFTGGERK